MLKHIKNQIGTILLIMAFSMGILCSSTYGETIEKSKAVFLVPISKKACWQDFAYLAAVPAATKVNTGNPVVLVVDQYGTIRPEMRDFLRRYKPSEIYLLDGLSKPEPTLKGLIAHWPMDDEQHICNDATGNYPAKLVHSPIWKNKGNGNYLFDGRTVLVDNGNVPGSSRELTVAFWMKADKLKNQKVMSKTTSVNREPGWLVHIRKNKGKPLLRFRVGGGNGRGKSDVAVNLEGYKTGKWIHVTCSHADGVSKIYLNNALKSTNKSVTWGTPNNTKNPLLIGDTFTGALDDVRIYDRELNYVEIQNLQSTSDGLVGHWPMNEKSGTVAHDQFGKYHLVFHGKPTWTKGRSEGGLHFNNKADHLEFDAGPASMRPLTILFSIRSNSRQECCLLRKATSADQTPPWSFLLDGSDLSFQIGNQSKNKLTVKNALRPGTEAMVGATYVAGKIALFINGKLAGTAQTDWEQGENPPVGREFDGTVDNLALYDRVLSSAEMCKGAGLGKGLVAKWEQKKASKTAMDQDWEQGKRNGAVRLNGTNSYVVCDRLPASSTAQTFACWVKPESTGCLVSSLPYEESGNGWAILLNDKKHSLRLIYGQKDSSGPVRVGERSEAFDIGTWVHIAVTMTDNHAVFYRNGEKLEIWGTNKGTYRTEKTRLLLGALLPGLKLLHGLLDDVRLYDRELSEEEILQLFASKPDIPGCVSLKADSADEAACVLARKFWKTADSVVFCPSGDYANALAASALAARLNVPLLYWDNGKFSKDAMKLVKSLSPQRALFVGPAPAPSLDGVQTINLCDSKAVLNWMEEQGIVVNYLAAANPNDRTMGRVHKASLNAPLLAAGRNGAVAILDFDTQWKIPFSASAKSDRPVGGIENSSIGWNAGTININGQNVPFVVTAGKNENARRIHIADAAGKYQGPYLTGDRIELGDKTYTVALDPDAGRGSADVWLTWPGTPEICGNLNQHYKALGKHPEYLCVLGEPDVIPHALVRKSKTGKEDLPTDLPLANTDDDPFVELALGRLVGETTYSTSLTAARGLVYDDLVSPDWAGNFGISGWEFDFSRDFESAGITILPKHDKSQGPITNDSPLRNAVAIQHGAHSWWREVGGLVNYQSRVLLSPCLIESGGCAILSLDRDNQGRLVVERVLRNGAVCFAGNIRNGVGQQGLYRTEFWNAILQGKTVGQAHRFAQNRAVISAREKGQFEAGYDRYQMYIRGLYGDPAIRIHLPRKPTTKAARFEFDGSQVKVYPPEKWKEKVVKNQNGIAERHSFHGLGIGKESWWTRKYWTLSNYYYCIELPIDGHVKSIEQEKGVPKEFKWSGKYWVDEHPDGTRSIFWRIKMLEVKDPFTGERIEPPNPITFDLK